MVVVDDFFESVEGGDFVEGGFVFWVVVVVDFDGFGEVLVDVAY